MGIGLVVVLPGLILILILILISIPISIPKIPTQHPFPAGLSSVITLLSIRRLPVSGIMVSYSLVLIVSLSMSGSLTLILDVTLVVVLIVILMLIRRIWIRIQ